MYAEPAEEKVVVPTRAASNHAPTTMTVPSIATEEPKLEEVVTVEGLGMAWVRVTAPVVGFT
jgi:hypothetical protein